MNGLDFVATIALITSAIVTVSAAYAVKNSGSSRFSVMPRNVRITEGYVYYGNRMPGRFELIRPSIADAIERILVRQRQGQFSRDLALDLISTYIDAVRREDLEEAQRIESDFLAPDFERDVYQRTPSVPSVASGPASARI
jgi:hypothetical protein